MNNRRHLNTLMAIFVWLSLLSLSAAAARNPFTAVNTATADPSNPSLTTIAATRTTLSAFHLQYLSTENFIKMIQQQHSLWLSSNAKVSGITQSNTVWVQDDAAHLNKLRELLKTIDIPPQQILIKAEVISLNHHTGETIGVQFGTSHSSKGAPPKSSGVNSFLIPLFTLSDDTQINMQLQALMQHGKAKLLANPELLTLNQQAASIESGEEIPYQQATSSGATSTTFKNASLKRQVTPTIMPQGRILLQIQLNQDTVSSLTVAGVPAISTQQLTTSIELHNHETAALGGILTSQSSQQHNAIPILSHLPLLGKLFKDHQANKRHDELLILITPDIQ